MQQDDDQNTFKFPNPPMIPNPYTPIPNQQPSPNHNLIQKTNLLHYGLNYLLPAFWYQELLSLNQSITTIKHIRLPPLQTYTHFLTLSGLQNPNHSPFHAKKHFPKQSALFASDFLEQSHYISSKTLTFSKIHSSFQPTLNQWAVINPLLWHFIQQKYQLQPNHPDQTKYPNQNLNFAGPQQLPLNPQSKSSSTLLPDQIPKISVFFTKQFIHQHGRCKGKQHTINQTEDRVCFVFKNVKYALPKAALNEEIQKQLTRMTLRPVYFQLIVEQESKRERYFRKSYIQGYFYQNIPFKELMRSLTEVQSLKRVESSEKFLVYDEFGEKVSSKISTVGQFGEMGEKKRLMVCTSELKEMMSKQIERRSSLVRIVKDIGSKGEEEHVNNENWNEKENENGIEKLQAQLRRVCCQKQVRYLERMIDHDPQKEQKKPKSKSVSVTTSTMTGFRPYTKQSNEIKILSGTYYRSDQSVKSQRNENNRESDEVRYLDSATTNLDTPAFGYDNQSENGQSQQGEYQNMKLHKHSSYNRADRKKKSMNYLQKKNKKNLIVRGAGGKSNSGGNTNIKSYNQGGEYKKRIRNGLFNSLWSLDNENDKETLEFLVENMRSVAKECVFKKEELIGTECEKMIVTGCEKRKRMQNKKQKRSLQWLFVNRRRMSERTLKMEKYRSQRRNRLKVQVQRRRRIVEMQRQLFSIAQQIQSKYEQQQLDMQKCEVQQQKCWSKYQMEEKLLDEYELKKDNEQIKTIIDNSEGPCSQVDRGNNLKIKYNRSNEKTMVRHSIIDKDDIKSLSQGLNEVEDNDETF